MDSRRVTVGRHPIIWTGVRELDGMWISHLCGRTLVPGPCWADSLGRVWARVANEAEDTTYTFYVGHS